MLYRHEDFTETLVHQCTDAHKYTAAHKREIANVRRHDVTAYLSIPIRDYKKTDEKGRYPIISHTSVSIKYCPYCGVNLETDEISGELLKLKLE